MEILEKTSGSETVLEAVKRNEAELSLRMPGGDATAASKSPTASDVSSPPVVCWLFHTNVCICFQNASTSAGMNSAGFATRLAFMC